MNKRTPDASENLEYNTSLGAAFGKVKTTLQIQGIKMSIDEGYYETGLKRCNGAIKREPKNAKLWILKSECLSNLERDDEALNCAQKAHSLAPGDLDIKFDYANQLSLAGHYQLSKEVYKNALKEDPDDEDALLNQSFNHLQLEEYKESLKITTKYLKKNPDDLDFLVNHAESLLGLGKFSKAKTAIEKALKSGGDKDSDNWSILAEAELGLNNGMAAQQSFRKAIEINPKNDRAIKGIVKSNTVLQALGRVQRGNLIFNIKAKPKYVDGMFTDKSGRKHLIEYKQADRRRLMEWYHTKDMPIFERIDVPNLDDKIVLRDYLRNRIIEIDLQKGKKPKCLFCESVECEHIDFVFTLKDIYKTLNRKHKVEQPKSFLKI